MSEVNVARHGQRVLIEQIWYRGIGKLKLWAKMDSNHRRYKPADLQSAPFGHSGIRPFADAKLIITFESAKKF